MITTPETTFTRQHSYSFGAPAPQQLGGLPFFPSFSSFLPHCDPLEEEPLQTALSHAHSLNSKWSTPERPIYLPPSAQPGRLTLFLDMDDTLIKTFSFEEVQCLPEHARSFDFAVCFMNHVFDLEHRAVYKRRGLDRFLSEVSRVFEVCLFTAADRDYAEAIVDHIDPHRTVF